MNILLPSDTVINWSSVLAPTPSKNVASLYQTSHEKLYYFPDLTYYISGYGPIDTIPANRSMWTSHSISDIKYHLQTFLHPFYLLKEK